MGSFVIETWFNINGVSIFSCLQVYVCDFVSFSLIVFSIDLVAHTKPFENPPTISRMKSYFHFLEQKTFPKTIFKYWLAYSS
jgi:hypothetical protein